jgi:hypothetical protein
MKSVKTINNQNAVTNAIFGLDNNSNTIINGNLNVNGRTDFNNLSAMNSGGRVYNNSFIVQGTDFRVMDSENLNGMQAFYDSGAVTFQGIGTDSRMIFRSKGSNVAFTNITLENNNHVFIEGQDGEGIDILNNQIAMNGVTTFNGVSNFNIGAGFNAGMEIRDSYNSTFSQIFHSINTLQIQTWTANGRIRLNTTGATIGVPSNNLLAENGNRIVFSRSRWSRYRHFK